MKSSKTPDPADYADGYRGYKAPPAGFRMRSPSADQNAAVTATAAAAAGTAGPECKKWVVAYSMYGDKTASSASSRRYSDGALANAELVKSVFPGWQMRVYHDDTVPDDLLDKLRQYGVELRDMTQSGLSNKMTWRFTVASDASVDRFIIRDLDSRLSIREKAAVDEWILSGKKFHIMRDHPSHSMFAMSGGMWGGTGDAVPQMHELITRQRIDTVYVADMNFLTNDIWPLAQQSVLQHDAFSCAHSGFSGEGGSKSASWPMPRIGGEHMGSVFMHMYSPLREADVKALLEKEQPGECLDRGPPQVVPPTSTAKCKSPPALAPAPAP